MADCSTVALDVGSKAGMYTVYLTAIYKLAELMCHLTEQKQKGNEPSKALVKEAMDYRAQVEKLVSQKFVTPQEKLDLIHALFGGKEAFQALPVSQAKQLSEVDDVPDFTMTRSPDSEKNVQILLKVNDKMYQIVAKWEEGGDTWVLAGTDTVYVVPFCGGGPAALIDEQHKPLKMGLALVKKMIDVIRARVCTKNDMQTMKTLVDIIASLEAPKHVC